LSAFERLSTGYKVAATVVGVIGIVVLTVVITLAIERRTPDFVRIGTAVVQSPIVLRREPKDSTKTSGNLIVGEPVEILETMPPKSADESVLIRSARNPKVYGYAPLLNLDHVQTNSADFDVWHALQLLEKASPAELKERLTALDDRLNKTPLPAAPESDQTYQTLARQSVRLANESLDNKDDARAAVSGAERFLGRLSGDSQSSAAIDEVRSAMQKVQIALGDIPDPEKAAAAPPPPSARAELSRLMKEANAAFDSGRYAKAADLSQQVSTKGEGKRDVATIVEQAKALQKKAETAQEEYEKVNIQKR
jgi:hypothetical protein